MMVNRITGYVIEGVGLDASYSGGVALHASHHAQPATTDYEWIDALTQEPSDAGRSIDPLAGELRTGGYTLRVSASDRLAALLGATPLIAAYTLSADRSTSDTTLNILGSSGLDGTVIWMGDEAILLGVSAGSTYTGCTRGYWGTTVQSHLALALVWDRVPYLRERVVRRVRYDRTTSTEEVIWRGFITRVTTSQDGTAYVVEVVDVLQSMRRATVNRDARDIAQTRPVARPVGQRIGIYEQVEDLGDRVTVAGTSLYLQVGPLALKAYVGGGILQILSESDWLLDTTITEEMPYVIDGPWWPLFLIDRLSDEASTSALSDPYHPITIALSLLMSSGTGDGGTYDILVASWGLGLTSEVVDVAGWEALRAITPDAQVDMLVEGWDGKRVDVWTLITARLLRPFGLYVTQTAAGRLGVQRIHLPTLSAMSGAATVMRLPRGPLYLDPRLDQRAEELTAVVGSLPWREGRAVTVAGDGGRRRRLEPRRLELDYGVIRSETLDMGTGIEGLLAATLVHLLVLMLDAAPRLSITIGDEAIIGSGPVALGDEVQLTSLALGHSWLVGADGARIEMSDSDVRLTALVVGIREDDRGALDVELALMGWRLGAPVRERAPAAISTAWDAGTKTHTLDSTALDFPGGDGLAFEVGVELTLWSPQGSQRASGATVISTTGTTITVDVVWSVAPNPGDVLRLIDSTLYYDSRYSPISTRSYAFLGDTLGDFEDEEGDIVRDNWGTSVYSAPGSSPVDPEYIAIDDSAVIPVATAAWPLDAWLGHRLREDISWLLQDGDAIGWQCAAPHGGDMISYLGHRPHCSYAFSTVLCIPWLIQPDLEEISIALVARVATESIEVTDQTAGYYDLRLQLDAEGLTTSTYNGAAPNTQAATPVWQAHTVTLALDASRRPRKRGLGRLILWGRGGRSSAAIVQSSGLRRLIGDVVEPTTNALLLAEGTGSRPNVNGIETCGLVNGSKIHDPLAEDTPLSSNPSAVLTPATDEGVRDLSRHHLDYMQVRGGEIRTKYADLSAPAAAAYAAQTDVTSELALAHAIRVSAAHARARCVYVGPPGVIDAGAPWPTGYGPRWPRLDAAAKSTLIDIPLWLDRTEGSLLVLAYLLPTWCLDLPAAPGESLDDLGKLTTLMPWEITATLEQLTTGTTWGTSATRGASTITPQLTHWPAVRSGRTPALTQEWYIYDGDWTYREGQLYPSDIQYLQMIALTVDVEAATDRDVPLRLRLELEADTAGASYPPDMAPTHDPGLPTSTDRFRVALVGCSIWEVS